MHRRFAALLCLILIAALGSSAAEEGLLYSHDPGEEKKRPDKKTYLGEFTAMTEDGSTVVFEYDSTPMAAEGLEAQRGRLDAQGEDAYFGDCYAAILAAGGGDLFGLFPVSLGYYDVSMGAVYVLTPEIFGDAPVDGGVAVAVGLPEGEAYRWSLCEGAPLDGGGLEFILESDAAGGLLNRGGLLAVFV